MPKSRNLFDFRKLIDRLRFLLGLILCVIFSTHFVLAHPVSQGAMAITVHADRIELRATVSLEEVLVADAWAGNSKSGGLEAIRDHGDYLLTRLHIRADGESVVGHVIEVPMKSSGQLTYRFEYRLTGAMTKRVTFRQDVLREFNFAPGNPWEASYMVRMGQDGQMPSEGLLFTYREPLVFNHDNVAGLDEIRLVSAYGRHGIAHILTGYDHLLFVGALVLAVMNLKELILVIAVFTLAHTLTLALSVLNIIRLPSSIVEPVIAASIVAVAVQNIFWPERSHGWTRLLLAFGFGLFHGLGFAGGLLDAMSGMAAASIALAIIAFSLGVEIGHLVVVLPAFLGLTLLRRAETGITRLSPGVQRYGSILITLFGLMYFYAALR